MRSDADRALSRARDAASDLLGQAREGLNGGARHAADRAEGIYEETLRGLEGSTRQSPLTALALALGIGFVIGLLAVRR